MIKRLTGIVIFAAMLSPNLAIAEPADTQVMMLGSFHFSNPGLDVVKTKQIDVTSDENQTYLLELSQRIAKQFNPDRVLIECDPKDQASINKKYQAYLQDESQLEINEMYQIGFRVAKRAGSEVPQCFDERSIQWQAEPLMKTMPQAAPETQAAFEQFIQNITGTMDKMHQTMTLRELLQAHNEPKLDVENKSLYILTNGVGAMDSFVGADAAASWWHRNFRMYANIQQNSPPSSRVLVIGGQGHVAILRDFLNWDSERAEAPILPLL